MALQHRIRLVILTGDKNHDVIRPSNPRMGSFTNHKLKSKHSRHKSKIETVQFCGTPPAPPPPPPPPPPGECVACGAGAAEKVGQITLRYRGTTGLVAVYDNNERRVSKLLFLGILRTGDEFTVRASKIGKHYLSSRIGIYANGKEVAELDTSCEVPIVAGMTEETQPNAKNPNRGVDVEILGAKDKKGRDLCGELPPPPPPPPPPGEVCEAVTDDCLTAELLAVTANDDGTTTYAVRLVYNCKKGLSFAAFELPPGVSAVSYTTGGLISKVENPGGNGGPFNPSYRNIKFEFGGDIKRGDSVQLSFTLPDGAFYTDGLRIRTKGGTHTQNVTLDPNGCEVDICELDQGPPQISYAFEEDRYIVVTITDDTGIADVDIRVTDTRGGTPNLELISSTFEPGVVEATYRYRLINFTQNTYIQVSATDLCEQVQCPNDGDNSPDELSPAFSVTGSSNSATGFVYHPQGVASFEFFRLQNVRVAENSFVPGAQRADFRLESIVSGQPTAYGALVATVCNATVIDPSLDYTGDGILMAHRGGFSSIVIGGHTGEEASSKAESELPTIVTLSQNYPNPFSSSTTIQVELPQATNVLLEVYNLLGQRVAVLADGYLEPGKHAFPFAAAGLANGTYIYRLNTPEGTLTRNLVITR